ncbi:chaplin [Streptacidiphilus sp. EB103A]|jgi:hypothetical protein|uniref:chaplin n=1 Tax=Streptacidiphilus sp. EB103A TaxID=3156275 RepID=UPI003515E4B1
MNTKRSMFVAAAAVSMIAAGAGAASASSTATGAATNSPGVLSGNNVAVPVHVPVNACGITVDVIGALNPAFGNDCKNIG